MRPEAADGRGTLGNLLEATRDFRRRETSRETNRETSKGISRETRRGVTDKETNWKNQKTTLSVDIVEIERKLF